MDVDAPQACRPMKFSSTTQTLLQTLILMPARCPHAVRHRILQMMHSSLLFLGPSRLTPRETSLI